MPQTVTVLPDAQLQPLLRTYRRAARQRRRTITVGALLLLGAIALAWIGAEVDLAKLWAGLPNFSSYFTRIAHLDSGGFVWTNPADWYWGIDRWSLELGQTILIAYTGTAIGFGIGAVGAVLASASVVKSAWLRFLMKRGLEFLRTVPDIVFALLFVAAFGLGPLPGVMAIALHTGGTLGKLFTEVIDNIDLKPLEGVMATGGSWLAQVRFGVLPQVLSSFASYTLLRFEINVRGAAVIGFVGAGGIGQDLLVAIRKFYYSDVSAMLLMILICVMLIDFVSERLRGGLLALERAR